MMEQINIFDCLYPTFKIDKPIRLIELFAGIGSQAMALRDLGANFEHYRISEWEVNANRSYKVIHNSNDNADYSKKFEKFKWLAKVLYEYGISVDGKTQLTLKEIRNRGENWCRQTYNEFVANHNFGSITNAHGLDLRIVDTDKYNYIMTYSFPCQDLSVAGKQRGMTKGSGTRSGLLWEVERLLNEVENLPQVLLMENVPQVHSKDNMPDFQKWIDFLTSKGYSNYWQDLNAKGYGVAQNRKRCFMVSILGEYNYKFPQPIQLIKTMKDYLEDEVEERYYINSEKAQKLIETLIYDCDLNGCIGNVNPSGKGINGNIYAGELAPTITTNKGEGIKVCVNMSFINPKIINEASTITAKNNRGLCETFKQADDGVLETKVKIIGKMDNTMDNTFESANRVYDKNGLSPTINTCGGGGLQPKIIVEPKCLNSKGGRNGIEGLQPSVQDRVYDTNGISTAITSSFMPSILEDKQIVAMRGRNPDNPSDRTAGNTTEQRLEPNSQGICNALTNVQKDNMVLIKQATKEGYIECECGGIADLSYPNSKTRRGRVQDKGKTCPTITSESNGLCRVEQYRIRKLTPLECWRLMGFSDEDFHKAEKVNSNSQLYKQAGNSIVKNVLMAIFGQMIEGKEDLYKTVK